MQRPIVIIGNNVRQIRIYARMQLNLKPFEYRIGNDAKGLYGLEKGVLIELEGCRRTTNYYELRIIADFKQFIKINIPW